MSGACQGVVNFVARQSAIQEPLTPCGQPGQLPFAKKCDALFSLDLCRKPGFRIPDILEFAPIFPPLNAAAGTVLANGLGPGMRRHSQPLHKFRRINGIDVWVERLFQIGEGRGVVFEVHLHAADIDIANALGPQSPHIFDGLVFGFENFSDAAGSNRPWLGKSYPSAFVPAPGFGQRDGLQ